uniref:Uncharacterized protein n=1 Tax=Daphnia galeata TaxID=27404 RepID=A0A8J2S836_9CRUS|nr:unnamed protein product [Daphnia galeata]
MANHNNNSFRHHAPLANNNSMEETKPMSKLEIGLFVFLIYVALVTISGGTVYAVYGWRAGGAASNNEDIKGIATFKQFCPTVAPCPVITCKEMPCVPSSTPSCFTTPAPRREPCLEAPPCPSGTCRVPPKCPTLRSAPPPIQVFLNSIRDTKTVSEWLNMYPPLSKSRLIVVTTLLDESIEPWALAGFVHRCNNSATLPVNTAHGTTCSFCQDRYEYIKCVMSNHLIVEPQTEAAVDKSYFQDREFTQMRGALPEIIYNYWRPQELNNIFLKMESTFSKFTVKTNVTGKSCRVCTDFNRHIYDKCFARNGLMYSPSFGRN